MSRVCDIKNRTGWRKVLGKIVFKIKRNGVDYLLCFIAANMLVFCCDVPVLKGFEMYDHTGKDFLYDISMALLTTIFIYFLQKKYTQFVQIKKYDKIIYMQCQEVFECVKEIVRMTTGQYDYLNISRELVVAELKKNDIDSTGAKFYVDNEELVLRKAILFMDKKMLQRIDLILGMPFVDADLLDILYELRTLDMHKKWEDMLLNAEGHLYTIEEEKGNSYGGLHCQFNKESVIADGIEQCIDKIKEIYIILEEVYGYSCLI